MKLLVYIPLMLLSVSIQAQEVEADTRGERCVIARHGPCFFDTAERGSMTLRMSDDELILKVYKNKFTSEELTTMFGKELAAAGEDVFIMEESFNLSEDLRESLGLEKETVIPVGEYPFVITSEIVEIKFRIEMK